MWQIWVDELSCSDVESVIRGLVYPRPGADADRSACCEVLNCLICICNGDFVEAAESIKFVSISVSLVSLLPYDEGIINAFSPEAQSIASRVSLKTLMMKFQMATSSQLMRL
jgi:hypothetical protein